MDLVVTDTLIAAQSLETLPETVSGAFQTLLTGIAITGNPSYDDWMQELDSIWHSSNAVNWATGDLLIYGEDKFGEKFAQAVDNTRWKIHTLQNIMTTCRAFAPSERRPNLVFSSHAECASLEGENRKQALDKLESGEWSRADVRRYKKELRGTPASGKLESVPVRLVSASGDGKHTVLTIECDVPFGTIEVVKAYRRVAA